MYSVSFRFPHNTDGTIGGEGYYSSSNQADVLAVLGAAIGTVDLDDYSLTFTQISAPSSAETKVFGLALFGLIPDPPPPTD